MITTNEKSCLVQPIGDRPSYRVRVSIGYVGLKNTQGPYAEPRQCFFKETSSATLKTRTNNPDEQLTIVVRHLQRLGLGGGINIGYDPDNSFETEEPNHLEVFMGMGVRVLSPEVAYTRDIGTCLGIGLYSPKTKKGSLFHIAGAEDSSIRTLADILAEEVDRLRGHLNAHFVSGLAIIDDESQSEIYNARQEAEKLLVQYQERLNKVERTLCETVGETIEFFSLDTKTGLFTVKTDMIPHHVLVEMDNLASDMH